MEDDTAFQSHEPATIQAQTAAADRMFVPEGEPFLNFHQNSGMSDEDETQLSLEDHSTLYCSLVALVKAQYPFDERLEDKAAWFLRYLPKRMDEMDLKLFLFTDLVPSSDGPCSGFVESILTLLSSRHSNVVEATVSFLFQSLDAASLDNQYQIMGTDFVAKVLAALQPDTQPLSGNEGIIQNLVEILPIVALLTLPDTLMELNITTAVDIFNHREMIFQKVVLPSSQFLTFLLTNRHDLNRDLANSFTLTSDVGNALFAHSYERTVCHTSNRQEVSLIVSSSTVFSPINSLRP
ncbi:hypothetical protein BLNAU_3062 [Blattamonas nauphoetae]|uniref:Uncharacterized protein n=1 Tax=Blattamonas nauphoetae TaxID=2049346 RepID=A0ABQ9YE14_9EUKA|nr:hypothetical protein BLNAU_3062 [Blattamonas nauphoetae]